MKRRTRITALQALCVLAVVTMVCLGVTAVWRMYRVTADSPSAGVTHPETMQITWRPSALIAGDDYAAGYGQIGRNAYPYILCSSAGMNCNVDAQTGTGLVNDGREYSSSTNRLIDRLAVDYKLYTVDLVIVDAGRNDVDAPVDTFAEALGRYLERVRAMWPAAAIYVIAPSYLSPVPYADYHVRVAAMAEVVARHHGALIDPVAEGWYRDVDVSTIRAGNGAHPSQAGQQLIADKLAEVLRRDGVVQAEVVG